MVDVAKTKREKGNFWQSDKLFKSDEERMLYSNILTIVVLLFSLAIVLSGITLNQNVALNNPANANTIQYSFKSHLGIIGGFFALMLLGSAAFRWHGSREKKCNGLYLMISWILLFIVALYAVYLLNLY